ncbi:DEAD/DEAH box helicase [Phaeospirillum tilakii]|uniref:DEAD/DEAH box helicase n=1 Tax=Phaeospirillum tilakii TaxID=741673 RepID=A0ABW5CFR6_9PROT
MMETTTSSHPSDSDSAAFDRLHPSVRRWIWEQQWTELRDIQEAAIPILLDGDRDLLISAATAGGKTEAAFLPIVSAIAEDEESGIQALYVSPLKALINDQFRRLERLCEITEIPVTPWHGDVSAAVKRRVRERPAGIVLITPESLEALFVRRGADMPRLFAALRYVVIDELHAFIGTERGVQMQSLLARLEVALDRRVVRVGLSATLGDLGLAAECLRPGAGGAVVRLESKADNRELRVQVRGYISRIPFQNEGNEPASARHDIAAHMFSKLRGSHNLIFTGSRQYVELYADALRSLCEGQCLPNEFFPHHGSLSKDLRETVETRLKDGAMPTSVVCTTTLELGIDIGDVESVAQIGAPRSIAALRQRLGRSGRRPGKPAVLRLYIEEPELTARSHPLDMLRLKTVQTVAALRLLIDGWCEPPTPLALHLSTLAHQVLSVIAQHGGIKAAHAYAILCQAGPFRKVNKSLFADLLRSLGCPERGLIEQSPDGLLMLGKAGERLVEHYSFYSVFETPEEFRVMSGSRQLGVLPVDSPLAPEMMIIFAGRRWVVLAVHAADKVLEVAPAPGGIPPHFAGGEAGLLHDRLVAEIFQVYASSDVPPFLDANGRALLAEGRAAWRDWALDRVRMIPHGNSTLLFPWVGTIKRDSLALALRARGFKAAAWDVVIEVTASPESIRSALQDLARMSPPNPIALARAVETKQVEKYDCYLDEPLLCMAWAANRIDADAVPQIAGGIFSE